MKRLQKISTIPVLAALLLSANMSALNNRRSPDTTIQDSVLEDTVDAAQSHKPRRIA